MIGQTVLITGATSGIGESMARYFAGQGAAVILVARNREKLERLQSELGDNTLFYRYDFCDLDHIEDIFQFMKEKGLKLSGMVHCAGVVQNLPIKSNDVLVMDEIMKVNCLSFFELGKYFSSKKYSSDGSSIIAVSSIEAQYKSRALGIYSASKSALNSAVITMAKEFVKRKIRVNAIMPAGVKTKLLLESNNDIDGFMEGLEQKQAFGLIDSIQIAYLAEFLLSDQSSFITGALIPVSAGLF